MSNRVVRSFCRICTGSCGVVLTVDDDNRIADIRGDKDHPVSEGYACFKGLQADQALNNPHRVLQPMKKQADGSFAPIRLDAALAEIAEKTKQIVAEYGPDSFGLFIGGGGEFTSPNRPMQASFMQALGSPHRYSTLTIDQSAKTVMFERMGGWAAGTQDPTQSEVILLLGANPVVSHAVGGCITMNPTREIKRFKARGGKLICIDPRKSETSRYADLLVQPIPGEDTAILAGLIRMVLDEGWEDKEFCASHVGEERMARLREVVEPFTPEMVARRARISEQSLRDIAEMFARNNKTGAAFTATGTNMSPFSNLAQHLVGDLNVICGRYRRPGDRVPVDAFTPRRPVHAQVIPPPRSWEATGQSRLRGVNLIGGEKLTGTMTDEILTPGPGQVRCMIIDGGNVAINVPDQKRVVEALQSLDLLVTIDPYMTVTAKLSDYILPPFMAYERPDILFTLYGEIYPETWCQYTPAAVDPPAGAELVHGWYVLWYLAKELGLSILYDGKIELDMEKPPELEELFRIKLEGSHTTLDELKSHETGVRFESPVAEVLPGPLANDAKFDVMPDDVAGECAEYLAVPVDDSHFTSNGKTFSHLLASRRLRDVFNSTGTYWGNVRKRLPHNTVMLCSQDLDALGLVEGDRVEIESDAGAVTALVTRDDDLRPGVINLPHGWGGLPGEDAGDAVCINQLIRCDENYETVNAMPRMSAIPVNIRLVEKAQSVPA